MLTTNLEGQGDIPKSLKFDVVDNARSLVRQDTGTVFNLKAATVAVFRATGGLACEPGTGISISQSEALLTAKQISVESSYCGYLANIARPAVCGIPTDKVYVHLVPQDQVAAAQNLGLALPTKIPPAKSLNRPATTNGSGLMALGYISGAMRLKTGGSTKGLQANGDYLESRHSH